MVTPRSFLMLANRKLTVLRSGNVPMASVIGRALHQRYRAATRWPAPWLCAATQNQRHLIAVSRVSVQTISACLPAIDRGAKAHSRKTCSVESLTAVANPHHAAGDRFSASAITKVSVLNFSLPSSKVISAASPAILANLAGKLLEVEGMHRLTQFHQHKIGHINDWVNAAQPRAPAFPASTAANGH